MTEPTASQPTPPVPTTPTPTTTPTTKPRKRGRWWKILLVVLVLLLLIVALLPTLLSTTPGKNFIVGEINSRISGKVAIDSLSLGWFSGISAKNVQVTDPDGKPVASIATVDTGLSILGALKTPKNLGNTKIDTVTLNYQKNADGSTNLARALAAPGTPAPTTAPAPAPSPAPAPPAAPPAPTGAPAPFPILGTVTVTNTTIDYGATDAAGTSTQYQITSPTTSLVIDPSGGDLRLASQARLVKGPIPPTDITTSLAAKIDQSAKTITLSDTATLSEKDTTSGAGTTVTIAKGGVLSYGTATSNLTISAAYDLDRFMALAKPFLPASLTMTGKGTMPLHITGALADGAGAQQLRGFTLDPTAFSYDQITFSGVTLSKYAIPMALSGGKVTFPKCAIPANNGHIYLLGDVDINGPTPIWENTTSANLIDGFQINHTVTSKLLNFLPISWGSSDTDTLATTDGVLTLRADKSSVPLSKAALSSGLFSGALDISNLNTDIPFLAQITQQLGPLAKLNPSALKLSAGEINTPLSMQDGRVSYNGLTIKSNNVTIGLNGSVGLVDQSISVTGNVTAAGINVPIPLAIGGTTTSPQVKIDSSSLGSNLQNSAPQLLEGLLNKKKKK